MCALDARSVMERRTLQAALVAGQTAAPGAGIAPAAAPPTYDPIQRFVRLVPGGNGIIYGIQADGALVWFRHTNWQNGAVGWANGGVGRQIGTGWQQFRAVLPSENGQLFGFLADGTVRWYRYVLSDVTTGAGNWVGGGAGPVIGRGFDQYPRVFGGWQGVIYGVDDSGSLWWYHYLAGNGTGGSGAWANGGTGSKIGSGWKEIKRLWADPNGVIFGVRHAGELRWWRYLASDGSVSWANGGAEIPIAEGWGEDSQKCAFSNGSGVIYSVPLDADVVQGTDDKLGWYQLANSESITGHTAVTWANRGNIKLIGNGFTLETSAALQGYAGDLSAQPGGGIDIAVSTTFASYTATVVRLAPAVGDPVVVSEPDTYNGRLQKLQTGYRLDGCGWQNDFTIQVAADWQPGIYAARLEAPSGLRYHVVFVVKPTATSTTKAPIAFLLPTNTYNAYNYWAGHNQYAFQGATQTRGGKQRIYTFLRPSTSTDIDPPAAISHTLYSDLFLLRWMSESGIAFDCYHDGDLHGSGDWLLTYKALVLASHPEYWTDPMRQNVLDYLSNGGCVICTGGNGFYERVEFTGDGNALIFRRPDTGDRDLFSTQSPNPRPESQIIGAEYDGAQPPFMTFAAYQVDQAGHPLLAGTGLSNGDRFGGNAYNGGASGWEVNAPADSPWVQIAHGLNQNMGAAMVYADNPGGGWVFSVNSISFNGTLPFDSAASAILKNVFGKALA